MPYIIKEINQPMNLASMFQDAEEKKDQEEPQASNIVDAVVGSAIGAFGRLLSGALGPPPPPNRSALKQNPKTTATLHTSEPMVDKASSGIRPTSTTEESGGTEEQKENNSQTQQQQQPTSRPIARGGVPTSLYTHHPAFKYY